MSTRWWVVIVVTVTWLTLLALRRWRRSVHAEHKSPQSSRSSQRIVQKRNLLADSDPSLIAHDSKCERCGVQMPVPMRLSRVERRPWRLVWWCRVCGRQSRALIPDEIVGTLTGWDRAFGTSLSLREVADMARVDLDELNAAIEDELL
jgi:hypothetical protein